MICACSKVTVTKVALERLVYWFIDQLICLLDNSSVAPSPVKSGGIVCPNSNIVNYEHVDTIQYVAFIASRLHWYLILWSIKES